MAKKIEIRATGAPSVLNVVDADVGPPGPGQVRLVQDAIGINYVDLMVRTGRYPLPLPTVPGFEAAGIIDAVGPGVSGFAPGDRAAYFFAQGAYATVSLVPADALVPLPDDISNEMAATYLAKGLTAWMGLQALHTLRPGDAVLVLGASGSVGSMLSRWAMSLGATVIGVAGSSDKIARVQAGATHALLASDRELSARIGAIAPGGVDTVYDLVGQATFPIAATAVRDGGVIAAIGAASGQPPRITAELASRGVQLRSGSTPQYVRGANVAVATANLWTRVREGIFADLDIVRYPFDDIARAHQDMEDRRLTGLPVLNA